MHLSLSYIFIKQGRHSTWSDCQSNIFVFFTIAFLCFFYIYRLIEGFIELPKEHKTLFFTYLSNVFWLRSKGFLINGEDVGTASWITVIGLVELPFVIVRDWDSIEFDLGIFWIHEDGDDNVLVLLLSFKRRLRFDSMESTRCWLSIGEFVRSSEDFVMNNFLSLSTHEPVVIIGADFSSKSSISSSSSWLLLIAMVLLLRPSNGR
jgi:hypothetical protein